MWVWCEASNCPYKVIKLFALVVVILLFGFFLPLEMTRFIFISFFIFLSMTWVELVAFSGLITLVYIPDPIPIFCAWALMRFSQSGDLASSEDQCPWSPILFFYSQTRFSCTFFFCATKHAVSRFRNVYSQRRQRKSSRSRIHELALFSRRSHYYSFTSLSKRNKKKKERKNEMSRTRSFKKYGMRRIGCNLGSPRPQDQRILRHHLWLDRICSVILSALWLPCLWQYL